jgi:hypothetical protein
MRVSFVACAALLCWVTVLASASARADVVYNETGGDPELSGNYLMPTPIDLGYGSNIVTLAIGANPGVDLDLFRVDLPAGGTLDRLLLTASSSGTSRSFMGFQPGSVWSFNMDMETGDPALCIDQCMGLGHFGPGQPGGGAGVGSNLFVAMNDQMPSFGRTPFVFPLTGSQYVFWVQELDVPSVQYSFDFFVSVRGDYNGDGIVNAADYTNWRNTLGQNVASGTGADGNRNSVVDANDYLIWKEAYGLTVSGSGTSVDSGPNVPEPSTLFLSGAACALFAASARRRKNRWH